MPAAALTGVLPLQGFQRVYEELGDISLDVPLAHGLLEKLVDLCFEEGVITKQLRDACPARYAAGLRGGGRAGRGGLRLRALTLPLSAPPGAASGS